MLRVPKHSVCTALMLFRAFPQRQQHVRYRRMQPLRRMLRRRYAIRASSMPIGATPYQKQNSVLYNPKRNVRVIVIKKKNSSCVSKEKCVRARHVQTLYRVCQLWFSVVDASAREALR
jgi:hypothetical protein